MGGMGRRKDEKIEAKKKNNHKSITKIFSSKVDTSVLHLYSSTTKVPSNKRSDFLDKWSTSILKSL